MSEHKAAAGDMETNGKAVERAKLAKAELSERDKQHEPAVGAATETNSKSSPKKRRKVNHGMCSI